MTATRSVVAPAPSMNCPTPLAIRSESSPQYESTKRYDTLLAPRRAMPASITRGAFPRFTKGLATA